MTPTTGAIPVLDLRDSPYGWHLRWLADCERSPGMRRLRYCCLRASGGGCCASPFPLRRRCPLQNSGTRSPGRRNFLSCQSVAVGLPSMYLRLPDTLHRCARSVNTVATRIRPDCHGAKQHGKSIRVHRYRSGVLDCSLRPENAGPRRATVCRCRVARGHG